MSAEKVVEDVYWVGVNLYTNDLFEGIWPIPNGVSLNTYVVKGKDKVALIDLVKSGGGGSSENLIDQLKTIGFDISKIDYLILNHLEPDHTGFLNSFRLLCPDAQILTSKKGVPLVEAFYNITENVKAVGDGDSIDLGGKILQFFEAPNVHWPETMVTFCPEDGILFSCDAFGSFGALKGCIFDDMVSEGDHEFFDEETLRYYANIVGPFSNSVLKAIEKLGALNIKIIAPSHGLIWRKNPGKIINDYVRYANYMNDYGEPKITVIWGSMYGNTETMMRAVLRGIAKEGVPITVLKVPETDISYVLAKAWESAGLVIACPTYEYKIFPPMSYVLEIFQYKHVWKKKVLRIGSYGWSGGAQKYFEDKTKNLKWDFFGPLEYQGAPSEEDLAKGEELGAELAREVKKVEVKKI